MDGPNWRPTQGADPAAGVDPNAPAPAGGDWRAQLQPEVRNRNFNKIMETLKKHLPVSGPEGLNELQKIAVRFEEKIYTAATNQSDYLRKISLKMLSMETKSQQPPGNAQVNPNQNPSGPAPGLPPQGSNPAQPSAFTLMFQQQARQPNTSTSVQASSLAPNQIANTNRRVEYASMDGPNWRPTQGADPAAGVDPNAPAPAGGDWRAHLQPEARTRIVNKIMETLKKHLPVSVPDGLNELQKIAVRFEEKIYTAATNQSDYLRKISLKMLSMEPKSQQPPGNAQVNPNQNPSGPGSPGPCSHPDHGRALKGKSNQVKKKKGRARQVKEKK